MNLKKDTIGTVNTINVLQRIADKISCELNLNKMANKTTIIKASEKTAQVLKIMKELKEIKKENTILKFKNDELTKQLTLGGVGCSLTDKKAINLLNELNKYATDFDYEFGLPLYDDIKFIDGYKGKQPIDELKDIVKKYIKV